ncbi:UNVERIFIED_CONTAM: hypothetical protein PYX00_008219 [Menopon gallinae]|uniref:Nuclear receptor domain-containing protein n=1 Tax=Menopon gallinae TaxID=328185 RepID=A0AAW2HM26_9NEOP
MDNDSASVGHGAAIGSSWWSPTTQPSPSTDVMNQLCRVCGEPAAGFHFGAFTCEGCKSFFGRTYNNLGSITECKNNGECVINKKNRTACKACRLRKCLLVGMSKSGSRYGRRSNWFKIHCLLQEQQQAVGGGQLKDKSALALWGESYKNLSMHQRFDSDAKATPTEEAISLNNNNNNNNNNNIPKDRERSPSRTAIPPNAYSAEAAAALWAARHSLFPMQLPHHHLPSLPLPYLSSFTNLHSPGHSHPQRNLLLPFIENLQIPPTSPHHPNHQPLTLSRSPSRSSRESTCSQSPSPNRCRANSSPNPDHSEKSRTSASKTPEEPRKPDEANSENKTAETNKLAEEHSLAMLRSLGPVQDQPMDLSVRVIKLKHRRKSKASRRIEGDNENSESDISDSEISKDGEVDVDGIEEGDQVFGQRKKPLDLTKPSKMEL